MKKTFKASKHDPYNGLLYFQYFFRASANCHHRRRRRLSRIRPLGVYRFRIYFSETYESVGQLVGLLGRGIGPEHRNVDTHPCLEWDSNTRSQCWSGLRQCVPGTTLHPIPVGSILILSSYLHLGLRNGFSTTILYVFLTHVYYIPCPSYSP